MEFELLPPSAYAPELTSLAPVTFFYYQVALEGIRDSEEIIVEIDTFFGISDKSCYYVLWRMLFFLWWRNSSFQRKKHFSNLLISGVINFGTYFKYNIKFRKFLSWICHSHLKPTIIRWMYKNLRTHLPELLSMSVALRCPDETQFL